MKTKNDTAVAMKAWAAEGQAEGQSDNVTEGQAEGQRGRAREERLGQSWGTHGSGRRVGSGTSAAPQARRCEVRLRIA